MTATRGSRSLSRPYVLSTVVILLLSVVSTLLGLLRPNHYNDPAALLPRLYAQDAVILLVAVPALAIGLRYAMRGSLRGRIVWLGALAFMTYVWSSIAGQVAFNEFFLGYVVLFALSLFTLVGGVVDTDAEAIRRALDGGLSRPLYEGFLALVAVGLALLWLSELVPATLAGTAPSVLEELGPGAAHTYVIDLGVIVPALAITAVLLHRDRPWGYVLAGVLLVMAAILAPSLAAITVVDVTGDYVAVPVPVIVGTILPPVVAAGFAIRYLLVLGGHEPSERTADERGVDA
jgi:hypothetical protein